VLAVPVEPHFGGSLALIICQGLNGLSARKYNNVGALCVPINSNLRTST